MLVDIAHPDWPGTGGELDVSAAKARTFIARGWAVQVSEKPKK